ncbi:hypothetical protein HOY80DRAFT_1093870 [Tuber brumale]|nr:hypothetical protein HOY80DRAFT_1093870 [Tuber brumale]
MYRLFAKRIYLAPRPFVHQPLRCRQFLTSIHTGTEGVHNSPKEDQYHQASIYAQPKQPQTPGSNDSMMNGIPKQHCCPSILEAALPAFKSDIDLATRDCHLAIAKITGELKTDLGVLRSVVEMNSERLGNLKTDMEKGMKDIKTDMEKGMKDIKTDMEKGMKDIKTDMEKGMKDIKTDMEKGMKDIKTDMKDVKTDMKDVETDLKDIRSDIAKNTADIKVLFWQVSIMIAGAMAFLPLCSWFFFGDYPNLIKKWANDILRRYLEPIQVVPGPGDDQKVEQKN